MHNTRRDQDTRLATTLTQLCEREGLDTRKTATVVRVAFNWTPELPREPAPLLRQSKLAAQQPSHPAPSPSRITQVTRSLDWLKAFLR